MRDRRRIRRRCTLAAGSCLLLLACAGTHAGDAETAALSGVQPGEPGPAPAAAAVAPAPPPLTLSLEAAVLAALEHNANFRVERLRPAISRTDERVQRAAFDPSFSASASIGRTEQTTNSDDEAGDETSTSDSTAAEVRVDETLPSGTAVSLAVGVDGASSRNESDSDSSGASWEASLSQSLLQGGGTAANLARLRQARLDTDLSLYEFRAATETLVAQVEQGYWGCILAERSMDIYVRSMEVALQEIQEVKERIEVGKLAETELAAAEAEVASRREQLIEARGTLAKRRLELIRLLNPAGEDVWTRELRLSDPPETDVVAIEEVAAHVRTAMEQRADLNQARLRVAQGDLETVRTRNGRLPKLDLFVSLGGSRYANSFSDAGDEDEDAVSYTAGLSFEMPWGNRAARARHERAALSLEQTRAALCNMEQLVQVDVRAAHVDVERAAERMKATKATRVLREKTVDNEMEKFRVGRATAFMVAQAGRDRVASEIAEVEAIIDYRLALLALYRLDGSLLARKGISVK
ncbi:MAG: TolC family protein [Planctomycetes bacterium]|nr:TolC family protein [Planctomycetota bacterium]